MVRTVAERVPQEEAEACAHNALKCVALGLSGRRNNVAPKATVEFLREKDLKLLLSDKAGSFVVLHSHDYNEKAIAAVQKHFSKSQAPNTKELKSLKTKAKKFCEEVRLQQLAKEIKSSKEMSLKPFFAVKTHKEGHPFRTIIEDKNTWQNRVAALLQRYLNLLPRDDPFLISNSEEVVEFLNKHPQMEAMSGGRRRPVLQCTTARSTRCGGISDRQLWGGQVHEQGWYACCGFYV